MKFLATAFTAALVALGVVASPVELEERQLSGPSAFNMLENQSGVNGSGCPAGSAYYALNAERTAVTVTFSNYYASAGPGIAITENRKNCAITLGVHVPGGYTFAIATVDYRGFYSLDWKVKAIQSAIYYFQGQTKQATASSTRVGPIPGKDYL
ncbi:hypothetical protein FRC17_004848, partial [Serendipita sp. 399]